MKNYIIALSALILSACAGPSSNFVNASLPVFKPLPNLNQSTVNGGLRVAIEPIIIENNNNYSDYFESSALKLRIDKEAELLKLNLEKQMKNILLSKGYEIDNNSPDYRLKSLVSISINEQDINKDEQFLKGAFVESSLAIGFSGEYKLVDAFNAQNNTIVKANTRLDDGVKISYALKGSEGVGMFKSTVSSSATQLNKELSRPAFEIDKSFLEFYKSSLNALNSNLKEASNAGVTTQKPSGGFNEFGGSSSFEENALPQENKMIEESKAVEESPSILQNEPKNEPVIREQGPKNNDGFVIFD